MLVRDLLKRIKRLLKSIGAENVLLILTVISVVIGVILGVALWREDQSMTQKQLSYLRFPGELFLRMLKMVILPLIMSSIVSSLASVDSGTAGLLGVWALAYYFVTTGLAVVLGIFLVVTIRPGEWIKTSLASVDTQEKAAPCISTALDTILDLMRNLVPDNLAEAAFRNVKTCMKYKNTSVVGGEFFVAPELVLNMSQAQRSELLEIPSTRTNEGMNILGVVMISVALGIIISRMGEQDGGPLKGFFKSLECASMKLISLVIWFSPVGILFLIAVQIIQTTEPMKELKRLAGYMITVLVGLFIHGVFVLPALLIILARRNPLSYVYGMTQALLTALATSSSSATLPLSIKCVEENNHVDSRVARFVLPLGATINMDGTALYEAVAAIYIAQTVGHHLSFGGVILVSVTATIASIGAAGIPQAGIVTMIMVLMAIGLPTNLFILIVPVDFFLDRIRTTINVHGDSIGAAVVERLCREHLVHQHHHHDHHHPLAAGDDDRSPPTAKAAELQNLLPPPPQQQQQKEGQDSFGLSTTPPTPSPSSRHNNSCRRASLEENVQLV